MSRRKIAVGRHRDLIAEEVILVSQWIDCAVLSEDADLGVVGRGDSVAEGNVVSRESEYRDTCASINHRLSAIFEATRSLLSFSVTRPIMQLETCMINKIERIKISLYLAI